MINPLIYIVVAFLMLTPKASAAILFSSGNEPQQASRLSYDNRQEADQVSSFWRQRKMAVGVTAAGTYGLMGGVVSVHFHPQWSVDLGFGGGSHFQSYGFRIKKMFLKASPLNPYFGLGFHRWNRTTTRPFDGGAVSPGYIAEKFLDGDDIAANRIDEKLAHASLGIQYVFTSGAWNSYGIFFELLYLMSTEDFDSAPTASLGINYFF